MDFSRYFRDYPDKNGRFGQYGGCHVPPELEAPFREIADAYQSICHSAEFINELRINHAARLLADSDLGISEIAFELKFQSLSRFYHLFKRQYACTPVEYRKRALSAKRLL